MFRKLIVSKAMLTKSTSETIIFKVITFILDFIFVDETKQFNMYDENKQLYWLLKCMIVLFFLFECCIRDVLSLFYVVSYRNTIVPMNLTYF